MIAILNAALSLLMAVTVCLSRPLSVFTVFQSGLWFFHHYRMKRTLGITVSFVLGISALLIESGVLVNTLVFIAGLFTLAAIFLNPDQFFPALHSVESVPADMVTDSMLAEAFFEGERKVVVIEVNGTRRAYPLRKMIQARHLVHDVVGDVPILITYCPLCGSAVAFQTEVSQQTRFFSVIGVFRRNLIMEDHYTHTIWQQADGQAIYGKENGTILKMLSAYQLSWADARKMGAMTLAMEPAGARKGIFSGKKGFGLLEKVTRAILVPGQTPLTDALDPREAVFGIQLNGTAKAYPLFRLTRLEEFTDQIGGVKIELSYDPEKELLLAKRLDSGEELLIEHHWWLGWKEFHPESLIWDQK